MTTTPANRYVSGIRPTGRLHLGNYLGVLKPWKELQGDKRFFIADLHSPSVDLYPTHQALDRLNINHIVESDYEGQIFRIQHEIARHVGIGRLERMTQYKDKCQTEQATLSLLSYPVLMAADIFTFGGTHIPVGDDQIQHIEFVRDVRSILAHHNIYYPMPQAIISRHPRIMSLSDGTKKMSKSSDDGNGCIYLDDSADEIRRKISSAKTAMTINEDTPEMNNLRTIYAAFGGSQNHTSFKAFKEELINLIIEELR